MKKKSTPTEMKYAALERENLRLQRKIAKLEVDLLSTKNTLAVLREYPEGGGISRAEMYRLVKRGRQVLSEFESEHQKPNEDT